MKRRVQTLEWAGRLEPADDREREVRVRARGRGVDGRIVEKGHTRLHASWPAVLTVAKVNAGEKRFRAPASWSSTYQCLHSSWELVARNNIERCI